MEIHPLDLEDETAVQKYHQAFRDAHLCDNPDRPMWSAEDLRAHLREPLGEEAHALVARAGDRLLGGYLVFYPLLDNLTMAYGTVFVAPAERNRGVGTALVQHLIAAVTSTGRTTLIVDAEYSFERRENHPYRRFAEKHGFTLASTEVQRRLDLPVSEGLIQAWIDEAAPHHEEYRLETYVDGGVPAELLPSLCYTVNQLAVEAPTGDLEFEAEQMTPDLWLQRRDRDRKSGLLRYDTVAIDSSGKVVAMTAMGVPAGDPGKVHQWATIVLPGHRGHRLGLALKSRNLRAMQHDHPDRTSIHTCNSEVNAAMIGINEKIGFKPVELMASFQRKLDQA